MEGKADEPVASAASPVACNDSKPARPPRWLEVSFGSAQKFFDQSVSDPTGFIRSRTLPVSTVRISGEWLAYSRLSAMALFDLPLEPRHTTVDGAPIQQYVPPALSGGIRYSVFQIDTPEETMFEGQAIALVGSTLAAIGRETVFPSFGWRLHLHDDAGFTMYAGASFEFRSNVISLTYGVGHRF
ncbi:MAG TPA: hypothetical protein VHM70_01710 [Polyangiaceae bacterium]|jgi:hypothetical protein|nr:hypothetical protein [Polyangiaceae bacterium]